MEKIEQMDYQGIHWLRLNQIPTKPWKCRNNISNIQERKKEKKVESNINILIIFTASVKDIIIDQ